MLENFIGKNVAITVAFANYNTNGGSVPITYYGRLQSVDTTHCLFYLYPIKGAFGSDGQTAGNMVINKDYIVACFEQA